MAPYFSDEFRHITLQNATDPNAMTSSPDPEPTRARKDTVNVSRFRTGNLVGKVKSGYSAATDKVKGLKKAALLLPVGLASSLSSYGVIIDDFNLSETSTNKGIVLDIKNDDVGVEYSELSLDGQLADMLWKAYGVSDLYGNDYPSFTGSSAYGFNISSGSPIKNGWNATNQPDGTILFGHNPGIAGFDYDTFDTGKTLTGFLNFQKSLLDTGNDGNPDYEFLLAENLTQQQLNNPGTIVGSVGLNNNGNFIEAVDSGAFTYTADGPQLAFAPTEHHPVTPIPEPSTYALIFGFGALVFFCYKRYHYS